MTRRTLARALTTAALAGLAALGVPAVAAAAPTAALDVTPATFHCGDAVTASGTGSTAIPPRTIHEYRFDFDDGAVIAGPEASRAHTYAQLGAFDVSLVVQDDFGDVSAADTKRVFMTSRAPTAVNTTLAFAQSGSSLVLRGGSSNDPDAACGDRIVDYTWRIDGGAPIQVNTPTHTIAALSDGPHVVSLTVRDTSGNISAADAKQVVWYGLPTALLDVSATSIHCGDSITASGARSSAPPPTRIVDYTFDFDDGVVIQTDQTSLTHTFGVFGAFDVTLRVRNDFGDVSAADTKRVVMTSRAPTALLTAPASVPSGSTIPLSGAGSTDPDGACGDRVAEWTWRVDGGPPVVTPDPTRTQPALPDGTHTVSLTVRDTSGDVSLPDTRQVIVNRTVSVAPVNVTEGTGGTRIVNVPVALSSVAATAVSATFSTVAGTAQAGSDYVATSGTVTIPAGALSGSIPVSLVTDASIEANETFQVRLNSASGAVLGQTLATVTIVNDDNDTVPPEIAVKPDTIVESKLAPVIVPYTAPTARDTRDGAVPVTCISASGAKFPLGATTVRCTAADRSGNVATSTFQIVVRLPTTPGAVSDRHGIVVTEVQRGQKVIVDAGGFSPQTKLKLRFVCDDGTSFDLASLRAGADGRFNKKATIPTATAPGGCQMTAVGIGAAGEMIRGWALSVS